MPHVASFSGRDGGERGGGEEEWEGKTPEGRECGGRAREGWDSRESRWGYKIHKRDSKPVITVRTSRPLWWSTFARGGERRANRAELEKKATDNSGLLSGFRTLFPSSIYLDWPFHYLNVSNPFYLSFAMTTDFFFFLDLRRYDLRIANQLISSLKSGFDFLRGSSGTERHGFKEQLKVVVTR